MNETIIANWNGRVQPDDEVYHLGDVGYKTHPFALLSMLRRLNGKIYLIKGNHDTKLFKILYGDQIRERFEWVKDLHIMHVSTDKVGVKQKITLCHYPMISWDASHHGSWQLHGHVHNRPVGNEFDLRMDVGVDTNNFHVYSLDEVKRVMEKKRANRKSK
jgi:calcineurin-like phosphoesterase family protein